MIVIMEIKLRNTDWYLEWIFLDGTKTIASKVTGCGYEWFMNNYPEYEKSREEFFTSYKAIENHIKLSNWEKLWIWYYIIAWWEFCRNVKECFMMADPVYPKGKNTTAYSWRSLDLLLQKSVPDESLLDNYDETIVKTLCRFSEVFFELQQYVSSTGYVNATSKLKSLEQEYNECNEKIRIDELYYGNIDRIDKYKLSSYQQLSQIKIFQKIHDMNNMIQQIFEHKLIRLLEKKSLDTIVMIPNNANRAVSFNQYMIDHIKKYCWDSLVTILSYNNIMVNDFPERRAQKTVEGICNRLNNANKLFSCENLDLPKNSRILLIDDAFWSGATMNMIAKKIKHKFPTTTIVWFSIIGSMRKWFDVLSEV